MSNIPVPMIHGTNDSERIQNIISYITRLADTLSRELNSIGLPNLSQELREKIDGAISQHQDLSEYAPKRYVKDNFIDNEEIASYATTTWVNNNFIDTGEIENYAKKTSVEELSGTVSNHSTSIDEIKEDLYGDGYFNKGIIKRLEDIEYQLSNAN